MHLVILETVDDKHHRSEHIIADSLDIQEPFRNIILVVDQRQPEANVQVYVDCALQGEIPLKTTLKQVAETAKNLPLDVVRFHNCF